MYIPKQYNSPKREDLIEFIQSNPFGQLISNFQKKVKASAIPFLIEKREDSLFLTSHLAKYNPQTKDLDQGEVMVIFQGPHAYISPKHYLKKESVPTWNYQIAQLRGNLKIIHQRKDMITLMEKMIVFFDAEYKNKWVNISEQYLDQLMDAVMGFEIEITEYQFCEKLSQDRSSEEQKNIIKALSNSSNTYENEIASKMRKKLF